MKGVDLGLLTKAQAKTVANYLKGKPSENRILVAVPCGELKSQTSNLIIAVKKDESEALPKKGVIVQFGHITEGNEYMQEMEIGTIVHYGIYSGKELDLTMDCVTEFIDCDDQKFVVLSANEIAYFEPNK